MQNCLRWSSEAILGKNSLHSEKESVCLGVSTAPACPVDATLWSFSREDSVPSGLRAVLRLWVTAEKHEGSAGFARDCEISPVQTDCTTVQTLISFYLQQFGTFFFERFFHSLLETSLLSIIFCFVFFYLRTSSNP